MVILPYREEHLPDKYLVDQLLRYTMELALVVEETAAVEAVEEDVERTTTISNCKSAKMPKYKSGIQLTNVDANTWVWTTNDIPQGQKFECKVLINDQQWATNSNWWVYGGQTIDIYPNF